MTSEQINALNNNDECGTCVWFGTSECPGFDEVDPCDTACNAYTEHDG